MSFSRFLCALALSAMAWSPAAAQGGGGDAQGGDDAELVDVQGSRLDKGALACTVARFAVKGLAFAADKTGLIKDEEEAATVALNQALADVLHEAQQTSGVSIDDVAQQDLVAGMTAIQDEFYAAEAERQNAEAASLEIEATRTAAATPAEEPEEKWNAFDYTRMGLGVASIADPSGVMGVAAAYTYPKCGSTDAETGAGGFCWRDSHTRGVGTIPSNLGRIADCPSDMTNIGLGCVGPIKLRPSHSKVAACPPEFINVGAHCHRGLHSVHAPSATPKCQADYVNMGLTCYRGPHSYGKGCTTVFKTFGCKPGYTDMGCHCQRWAHSTDFSQATCPEGYFLNGTTGRCHKKCGEGYQNTGEYCTRWVQTKSMDEMTCEPGYFRYGARCYANCDPGFKSAGEFCINENAFYGMDRMTCNADEFKSGGRCYPKGACGTYVDAGGVTQAREMQDGLCYQSCNNNFYGIGPVCWSSCTGKLKTECAAGCAASGLECGLATTDMIASPFEVVLSVVSLSTYAAANSTRKAATQAAKVAAREAVKAIAKKGLKTASKEAAEKLLRQARTSAARTAAAKAVRRRLAQLQNLSELSRQTARQAVMRIARDAYAEVDDEAFDLAIRWSDDLADEARQPARSVSEASLKSVDEQFDALDDGIAEGLDDAIDSLPRLKGLESDDDLLRVKRPPARRRAADPPRDRLADRVGRSILRKAEEANAATRRLNDFVDRHKARLAKSLEANVFKPVKDRAETVVRNGKAVKDYIPRKLREKSEIFDSLMNHRAAYQAHKTELTHAHKIVGFGRVARNCTKLGIVVAQQF